MVDLAVIMSVYYNDKLHFLKESIESILNQSFSEFHYFLIFDGPVPSDIEEYITSLNDNRIRLYRLEKNTGLAAALNYLLEIILKNPDYKYIARMDADDISMPERFEKQRSFLIKNPDITILGSWFEEIDESGKHLSKRILPTEHEALKKRYYTRTPFAHSSVVFHRRLIEIAGNYPTNTMLMEDNVLWGKGLKCKFKFANLPEFLINFRIDKNFYKRRTGLSYGFNYIRTKFKMNRMLQMSTAVYFQSIGIGLLKMLPAFSFKLVVLLTKK